MVCCLPFSNKHPSSARVGGYVSITSSEGMAPNDVTNVDASATPGKNFLERFPVSPDIHERANRIAHRQSLKRENHCIKPHHCRLAWHWLRFLPVHTEPSPPSAQESRSPMKPSLCTPPATTSATGVIAAGTAGAVISDMWLSPCNMTEQEAGQYYSLTEQTFHTSPVFSWEE